MSDTENSNLTTLKQKRVMGFDAENKDCLPLYICHICTLLLRCPYQLSCGHRFCQSCIDISEDSIVRCITCNEKTPRNQIMFDRGCQHDMKKLNINCSFCDWKGLFKNYQEHLDTSHLNPFCEHCGEEFHSVDSLTQHTFVCEKVTVDCVLKQHGCDKKFFRINARDHFLSEQHQSALLKLVSPHLMSKTDDQKTTSSQMDASFPLSTSKATDETLNAHLKQLHETMDILMNGIQVLNDEAQRLSSELLHCQNSSQSVSEDSSKIKTAVQETNTLIDAQTSNQLVLEQGLASLQQQVNDMKNTSYDGTLIWKTADIQKKIADAQSERQTSVYSPVFYSSINGYKMRVRLYLNGDGNARRTHVSIFFVLMRGDNDAILDFPFNFKVTFCLLDQSGQQKHIIDSFRPDPKSNSFQRPRTDMNIASGIPKFCPLTVILQDNNSYVRDDAMFIKVIVDFSNMHKGILPYVVGLNPGLPAIIQQESIKREVEKRVQEASVNATGTDIKQTVKVN